MIILHKAKRIDNNEEVKGFLTKMWGQYHIIMENDENLAFPISEETIIPCFEHIVVGEIIKIDTKSPSYIDTLEIGAQVNLNITKEDIENSVFEISEIIKYFNMDALQCVLEICNRNNLTFTDIEITEMVNSINKKLNYNLE